MNREIKFRVWVTCNYYYDNPVMLFDYFRFTDRYVELSDVNMGDKGGKFDMLSKNDCVVMQYTGLKDKNGVEIYEGDVVRLVGLGLGDLGCYEVEFNDDSASFLMYFNQEIKHFIDYHSEEEIEVIGNIYENPELLESK